MPRRLCPIILCSLICVVPFLHAQETPAQKDNAAPVANPERQHALELYGQGKMVEAMPLLEKVLADNPKDIPVSESLGMATLSYAQTLKDPELKKKARVRARTILLRTKDLGDNSNLLQTLLNTLPEDGSSAAFSDKKEVDSVMQQAETDYVRGDYDKAILGYSQALLLDPNLYEAALFTGDVYFKQHKAGFAGDWFQRAIEINPNRETAYRYWGDTLKEEGKMEEARTRFMQAVVADPYNKSSWVGLSQWADTNKVKLNFIRLKDKGSVNAESDKKINITLDSSMDKDDPSMAAWLMYSMGRAQWQGEKFKKEFPNEPKYRHTLREEADSLHLMAAVLAGLNDPKKKKKSKIEPDPALVELVKIDQAGLMEPFVLLNRADADIAKDYEAYRDANRDKMMRYMDEVVVPKTPK